MDLTKLPTCECYFRAIHEKANDCRGPVISPQARERIEQLIESCEKQGGNIVLDGRGATVKDYPNGNWVGPTILEATTDMDCYK